MTKLDIQSEADALAAEFSDGQLNKLANRFQFPVMVYIRNRIIVLKDAEKLLEALWVYRSILSKERLSHVTSTAIECEKEADLPCKVSVENRYFSTDGRNLGAAKINYFSKRVGSSHKISMVEYLDWPCPDRIADCEQLQRMML